MEFHILKSCEVLIFFLIKVFYININVVIAGTRRFCMICCWPLLKIEAKVSGSRFLPFSYKTNNKIIHLGLIEKNIIDEKA